MGDENDPAEGKPINAPRPCPYCGTETPAYRDPRIVNPAWRWECNQHGLFACLILVDPLR